MRRFYTTCFVTFAVFIQIITYGQVYIGNSGGYTKKTVSSTNTSTTTSNSPAAPSATAATLADGQDPTNLFPPSPTAAGLARYGDIPVSNHTGTPNINIPLYEIKTRELSLPISLSYHASGIKVADLASWVGLGWSLNVGGVITRTIQSLPDEGAANSGNGYLTNTSLYRFARGCEPYIDFKLPLPPTYNHPGVLCTNPTQAQIDAATIANTNYVAAQNGQIDMEPDIFYFNVGGFSGKFIFDQNGKAHMFPEQDMKIEFIIESAKFKQFILTVPSGTKYYFGDRHGDGRANTNQGAVAYESTQSQTGLSFGSSWFLTKIVSANGLSKIYFTYAQELYDYFDIKNQYLSNQSFTDIGVALPEYFIEKTRINGVRLTQIHTSEYNTKVLFQANTVREDVGFESDINNPIAYRLDEIHVLSDGGTGFKKFIFNYDYFVSTGTSILPIGVNAADFTRDKKRLKLLSVREQSYDGSIILPAHQFEYNTTINIPRRISFGRDHWGYYNGKENYNRSLIHQRFYNGQAGGVDDGVSFGVPRPLTGFNPFLPSDRSTNDFYTKFASLTKIIYPTGGSTIFDMESHVNGNYPTIPIGGLRIKTIKNNDSDGTTKTQKNFDYLNSGTLFSKPTYYFQANLLPNVYRTIQPPIGGSNLKDIASSSPVLPLSTTQGSHIGYHSVKISEIGNGSTTYTYNISGTYPTSNGNSDFFGVDRLFNFPLDPLKDNYRRGQLEKEEVKNEIGVLINETIYNYTVDEKQVIIPAIKIDANTLNGYPSVNLYNRYAFFTGRSDLTSKTVTTCGLDGTNCITRTSTYNYDSPYHFQMTSSTEESSNGELVVSKMQYAQDYTYFVTPVGIGSLSIAALKAKNMVVPVETNTIRKAGTLERVLSGGINYFDPTLLKTVNKYILETLEPISTTGVNQFWFSQVNQTTGNFFLDTRYPTIAAQYNTYYSNSGNVKESFVREGTNQVTTYLWGYNHAFPIAEIQNANYSTVVATLGQTVIDNLANTNNQTDSQIRAALAPLLSLPNALTTIYTYNPLVGVTSVISPDGIISYYEYDKLGRLQFIKNNKGEIVKGYKYGYK